MVKRLDTGLEMIDNINPEELFYNWKFWVVMILFAIVIGIIAGVM